jgi:putative transposase
MVRGNDRQDVFACDGDRLAFLRFLREAAQEHGVSIHAYVLMSNHVHLLATGEGPRSISLAVQSVGRHYVPSINRRWGRVGTLWQGRFKSLLVDNHRYALFLQRYIELNPVRAWMTPHPADFIWSSHLHHAHGKPDDLLTPHVCYLSLGETAEERRRAYSRLFEQDLPPEVVEEIRQASKSGWVLAGEELLNEIERVTGRRVRPLKRGRPRK